MKISIRDLVDHLRVIQNDDATSNFQFHTVVSKAGTLIPAVHCKGKKKSKSSKKGKGREHSPGILVPDSSRYRDDISPSPKKVIKTSLESPTKIPPMKTTSQSVPEADNQSGVAKGAVDSPAGLNTPMPSSGHMLETLPEQAIQIPKIVDPIPDLSVTDMAQWNNLPTSEASLEPPGREFHFPNITDIPPSKAPVDFGIRHSSHPYAQSNPFLHPGLEQNGRINPLFVQHYPSMFPSYQAGPPQSHNGFSQIQPPMIFQDFPSFQHAPMDPRAMFPEYQNALSSSHFHHYGYGQPTEGSTSGPNSFPINLNNPITPSKRKQPGASDITETPTKRARGRPKKNTPVRPLKEFSGMEDIDGRRRSNRSPVKKTLPDNVSDQLPF